MIMKFRKAFSAVLISIMMIGSAVPALSANAFELTDDIGVYDILADVDSESVKRAAGDMLRSQLVQRAEKIDIYVEYSVIRKEEDINDILNYALEETGNGNEGDYLRWAVSEYSYYSPRESYLTDDNVRARLITFDISYNSNAEQERQVTNKLSEVYSQLSLDGMSDIEKINTVYGYITDNVRYPDEVDINDRDYFSPYGALIEHEAVCQGFALLLYRMLIDSGLDCRVVPGKSDDDTNHAWNIVRIGDVYYYLDSTWDAGRKKSNYIFYLRGSSDFDSYSSQKHSLSLWDHSSSPIYDIFDSGDFYKEHPVSLTAYSRRNIFKLGDINADGKIDSSDATEVLSAYSLLSVGKISGLNEGQTAAADTDGDGIISSADATIILMYYSYLATGGEKTFDQFLLTR